MQRADCIPHFHPSYRDSCGVDLGGSYVITGGYKADKKVSVYSTSGWTKDLPDLKEGRYTHSCSRFDNDQGEMVLMVTGGWTENITGIFLSDSTEMLLGDVWTEVTSAVLPSHTYRSVSLNINNVVFIFGREKVFLKVTPTLLSRRITAIHEPGDPHI